MANDGRPQESLLPGRSTSPLTEQQIRAVSSTFLGLDPEVPARHNPGHKTCFSVVEEDGEEVGVVYFGSDIYPGPTVHDPNAALSMKAAAAHEISHFHRWRDQTELPIGRHRNLDEACTSLDAILRHSGDLSDHEIQQLVRDALQRLQLLRTELLADEE